MTSCPLHLDHDTARELFSWQAPYPPDGLATHLRRKCYVDKALGARSVRRRRGSLAFKSAWSAVLSCQALAKAWQRRELRKWAGRANPDGIAAGAWPCGISSRRAGTANVEGAIGRQVSVARARHFSAAAQWRTRKRPAGPYEGHNIADT